VVALFPEKRKIFSGPADLMMRHWAARLRQNWTICVQMRPVTEQPQAANIRHR
jgi:hypothetical protein